MRSATLPPSPRVWLRNVIDADLPIFFAQQLDPEARWMAAFTTRDAADRAAFDAHWGDILADAGIIVKTILHDDQVAGSVLLHNGFGQPEVGYWLGKAYWGQGIATHALRQFLQRVPLRPLFAVTVHDNVASQRVLMKCGFVIVGEGKGFSHARGVEVDEMMFRLNAPDSTPTA